MTRGSALIIALAAAALSGCQDEPAPKAGPAPVPYVGPATGASNDTGQGGEPVWRYNGDDDHLLARGVDNSNVIDMVFRCGGEIPGITFSFFMPAPPPETVRLSSGGAVRDYPIRPTPPNFGFSTDWSLAADAIAKDPVVTSFLDTGKLTQGEGDTAKVWDARTAKDKESIDAFSKACKGKL